MLLDTLFKRRSIRTFSDAPVSPNKIDYLVTSALLAPSSRNIRPWRFIVIDDRDTITRLASAKPHGADFLKTAPLAIAVVAETAASDVWVEDTSIASAVLLLTADELGLGACWCQIRKRDHSEIQTADAYVREVLAIPETYSVAAIIGVGYAETPRPPYQPTELRYNKVSRNAFETPYSAPERDV